jgi:hypothetical protein
MKQYFLVLILTSITFNSFSQEGSEIRPFFNPTETKPRFIEDKNLSERENLKTFNKKLRTHFNQHLKNSNLKDSIESKIYILFKIDTIGLSQFHKIRPQEFETKYLKKEISTIVNALPQFIPATQRNKKVTIIYVIPLLKNE